MGRQGTGNCDRRPRRSMYFMMISFLPSLGRCAGHTQLEVTEDDPGDAGSRLLSGAPRCSSYIYDTFMFSVKNRKYLFRGNISHHMNTLDSFLLFRQPK